MPVEIKTQTVTAQRHTSSQAVATFVGHAANLRGCTPLRAGIQSHFA